MPSFQEAQHPRYPKGHPEGGKFKPTGRIRRVSRKTLSKLRPIGSLRHKLSGLLGKAKITGKGKTRRERLQEATQRLKKITGRPEPKNIKDIVGDLDKEITSLTERITEGRKNGLDADTMKFLREMGGYRNRLAKARNRLSGLLKTETMRKFLV